MIYLKLNPECTRLGNWLFTYAGAVSEFPGEDFTFVLQKSKWLDDPRNYSVLWPSAKYEICEATDCLKCGKCQQIRAWGTKGLNQAKVQDALRCPTDVMKLIFDEFGTLIANRAASISVRRGDYLKFPHTHPFVGTDFLKKAIKRLSDTTNFIVCSDDIPWCKKFFCQGRFPDKTFYFTQGSNVLRDLFLPTFCSDNIISNSTFSWWGAYLNPTPNKRIIAPSMWLGIAAEGRKHYLDQFVFPGMEIIPNGYSPALFLKALVMWGLYKTAAIIRSFK